MDSFLEGNSATVVQRFVTVDPVTEIETLVDPSGVTFTVRHPDSTDEVFVYGTDEEATRSSVGVYVLTLPASTVARSGIYLVRAASSGPALAYERAFEIVGSFEPDAVASGQSPAGEWGPCQPWISGEDVAGCADLGVGSDLWKLDAVAREASAIMYVLSGRRFPGVCVRRVRPCRTTCGCWGPSAGLTPWSWTMASWGGTWPPFWTTEGGDKCGCEALSVVKLAGYPVRRILEVKIDGVVLPQFDDNNDRNWRLDGRRNLVRMDSPSLGKRRWPGCQNLALDDTEQGTFSVEYEWGAEAPMVGRAAAAALAAELWRACDPNTPDACRLPESTVKVVRAGVTVDRVQQTARTLQEGESGVTAIDAFMSAVSMMGASRRPAVWSPDRQRFARRVDQNPRS